MPRSASKVRSGLGRRPTDVLARASSVEQLEPRRLMAFSAHINFQPADAATPANYLADVGKAYPQQGTLKYGWNGSNFGAIDRNSSKSPDQRYDTFNFLKSSGNGSVWEIGVPNGTYTVHLVAGDPLSSASVYKVNVEGVLTVNGTPTSTKRWIEGTQKVKVTDGRLTVRAASGASNVKLNFIDIAQVVPPKLAGLTLIEASTDRALGPLVDGQKVDRSIVGTQLSVRADADAGGTAASVIFKLDGNYTRTESGTPWALAGDVAGDYAPLAPTLSLGSHTLTVTPYSGNGGTGTAGAPIVVHFTVIDSLPTLDAKIAHVVPFAAQQLGLTLGEAAVQNGQYPIATRGDGTWITRDRVFWSGGFLAGSQWELYRLTGDAAWKTGATSAALGLSGNETLPEDSEFRSFVPLEPLYNNTLDAQALQTLLTAAASKSAQFNSTVGAFFTAWRKSDSGDPRANFGVLMDQMMDLELLFWAAKQTGNQVYYDQAVSNAKVVQKYLVRADGGSSQWGYFDKADGKFIGGETAQGYADSSTWSRGQAWGIYAFTMVYRETKDPQFLATAKKMADYFIAHLPADEVPFWDFDDLAIPKAEKDSSAAAIASSGMFELAKLAGATAGAKYLQSAKDILKALATPPYLAEGTNSHGILNRGAWYVPAPNNMPESSTAWGDYYFLEAISRYLGKDSDTSPLDTSKPVAAITPPGDVGDAQAGTSSKTVEVVFSDNVRFTPSQVTAATLKVVNLSKPGAGTLVPTAVVKTPGGAAVQFKAEFIVPAPGGTWDAGDNGVYQVSLPEGAVVDAAGNRSAAVTATFDVAINAPSPVDALRTPELLPSEFGEQ